MEKEIKASRKSKFVKTLLGRTRPLAKFYDSEDRGLQNHGDRCVSNTKIQGCLQGHERCLTSEGYLPILEIKRLKEEGKDFKVWTGVSWESFKVIDRDKAQLAEIELSNGLKIDVDVRHEVLVEEATGYTFKKFQDLDEDTRICTSIPTEKEFGHYPNAFVFEGGSHNSKRVEIRDPEQWNKAAHFLGCVIGDGSVSEIKDIDHNVVRLCFGEEKIQNLLPTIKTFIESLGLNVGGPVLNKGSNGVSYSVPINSKGIVCLLKEMGYNYTNALNKRVPEMIFRSPVAMRKAFLRGYYDTDGAKSKGNKHSFHTPNKDLLRDVQLIAWTLGCASSIHKDCEGAYLLRWVDTWDIEHALGLESPVRYRRNNSALYPLPEFMRSRIITVLDGIDCKSKKDIAYKNKIKKGKSVSIPGVVQLLKSYGSEIPELYYTYGLKEKRVSEEIKETYTLSVNSPLHRYDSAGIISRNCCADIMKTVMAKLYSWIHRNNLQDDVKVLITMHDELVMEITTEKLELLVPEITKIMMLPEIINDVFHWPIPLTVDVKYGDSWRVKKKFYEDFPQAKDRLKEPLMEFSNQVEVTVKPEESVVLQSGQNEASVVQGSPTPEVQKEIATESEEVLKEVASAPEIESMSASEDLTENKPENTENELIYTLRDTGDMTLLHLNNILTFVLQELKKRSDRYISEKKILRIRDSEGHSVLVSEYKVPVDLFLGLSRFFRI